ncbi:hypothetical protein ON010_g10921 [Phytophthora cinnamomi]|nr:hypothetical protein ON010_g10921 [Phytophthora cinnamomi]
MAQIAAYEIVNSTYQLDEDATRECTKLHVHPMIYGIDAVHGNSLLTTPCTSASKPTACPRSTRTWSTNKVSSLRVTPWRLGYLGSSAPSSTSRTTSGGCGRTRLSVKTRISPLRGMQSNNRTAACMKHWSAYSWNPTGHDMDEIVMADFDLLSTFVPSFKAAVDAGVLTAAQNAIAQRGQIEYANALAATSTKLILVLFEGRPRLLQDLHRRSEIGQSLETPVELVADDADCDQSGNGLRSVQQDNPLCAALTLATAGDNVPVFN